MGRFDSSQTRVAPVFNRLFTSDPTGFSWIDRLLQLPVHGASSNPPARRRAFLNPQRFGETHAWGQAERGLEPPRSLLRWLVENLHEQLEVAPSGSGETAEKRGALYKRDPAVIEEALGLVDQGFVSKKWWILEGKSYPDVYLQTEDTIIVIEGKRTEAGPTLGTTWMPKRRQMLRHLDCAWEVRGEREVFGFFIVEGAGDSTDIPQDWVAHARDTVQVEALDDSLPHRTSRERQEIAGAFLGVTTWQAVCDRFGIPWSHLPDEIVGP